MSALTLGKQIQKLSPTPSKLFPTFSYYVKDIIFKFGKLSFMFTIFRLFISLQEYFVDNSNLNCKMLSKVWIINGKIIFMLLSQIWGFVQEFKEKNQTSYSENIATNL